MPIFMSTSLCKLQQPIPHIAFIIFDYLATCRAAPGEGIPNVVFASFVAPTRCRVTLSYPFVYFVQVLYYGILCNVFRAFYFSSSAASCNHCHQELPMLLWLLLDIVHRRTAHYKTVVLGSILHLHQDTQVSYVV